MSIRYTLDPLAPHDKPGANAECWWPEDSTGKAAECRCACPGICAKHPPTGADAPGKAPSVSHDAAVQIALERRRVADELDRERLENVRLRKIIVEVQRWARLHGHTKTTRLGVILARVEEQP
jgi:hypothetical protein